MRDSPQSRLVVQDDGDVTLVGFTAHQPLDELAASPVAEELSRLVDRRNIRLSFRNVDYLSSSMLGVFITFNKLVGDRGGKLTMGEMTPKIYEIFEITKLTSLFEISHDPCALQVQHPGLKALEESGLLTCRTLGTDTAPYPSPPVLGGEGLG